MTALRSILQFANVVRFPVIFLFYGADTYSMREATKALQEAMGSPDVWDANTTILTAAQANPEYLINLCATIPFLSERRLVIVEGLLSALDGSASRRAGSGNRASASKKTGNNAMKVWLGFSEKLAAIAPTTDLVFLDGSLQKNNPLLRELTSVAQKREFAPFIGTKLDKWIRDRVTLRGATITSAAVKLLIDMVGANLWTLSNEIEKLALYCGEYDIGVDGVEVLVTPAREAKIFAAVDAVMEGDSNNALRLVSTLLDAGNETAGHVFNLLVRQVRLALLAQDMLSRQIPEVSVGTRLGISAPYVLRKTVEQAKRSDPKDLRGIYETMLETDVSVKTGEMGERLALEFLIARIAKRTPLTN
jgi:DNA polymerase-3 subunit delta